MNDSHSNESVTSLVKRLGSDLSALLGQELALAKAEIHAAISRFGLGLASVAIGGSVLFAGFIFLLAGLTLLLADHVQLPVAALIVGTLVAISGVILFIAGRKKVNVEAVKPDGALRSVKEDASMLKRTMR